MVDNPAAIWYNARREGKHPLASFCVSLVVQIYQILENPSVTFFCKFPRLVAFRTLSDFSKIWGDIVYVYIDVYMHICVYINVYVYINI